MSAESSTDSQTAPPRPRRRRRRWFAILAVVMLFCGILVWWNRVPLLRSWGRSLNVGQPLTQPVDYVVVLGGGIESRPFVAAEIYRAGFTTDIVIVKPLLRRHDALSNAPEEELSKEVLLRLGVPEQNILLLPGEVDSTEDEMRRLSEFLEDKDHPRVAVVTDDYHTRRASILLQRICGSKLAEFEIVSAPVDDFSPDDWWQSEHGIGTYLLETVKLISVVFHAS